MNVVIDLENKEAAKDQIKLIQGAMDDFVDVINKQSAQLKENVVSIDEAKKQIVNLTAGSVGLADTIKAIHLLLGRKKDLFKDDKQMNELMNELATFVVSSGAIKLGVLSHAMEGEKDESN